MKRINYLLLLFLPFLLFIVGIYVKSTIPEYSINGIDPEYAYLFNGLNLATFNFPWHIDHPGTLLQIISAIAIRVTHIFHNPSIPLIEDVFSNPDFYLNCISGTLILIDMLALFILGWISFKASKNIFIALFLQFVPFISTSIIDVMRRVLVEHLIIAVSMLLIAALINYMYRKPEKAKPYSKQIIWIGILTALGISCKITFATVFFIPFFIIEGFKRKMAYASIVAISVPIFIFPIFSRWVYFRDWITKLFIHSGQYGKGEANIVDVSSFVHNLKAISTKDILYPIVFLLFIVVTVICITPFIKTKVKNNIFLRGLIGIILSMTFLTTLVAKQYKYFYLVPVLIFIIPGIFERLYGSFEIDNSLTKKTLSYSPRLSTEEGINKMVKAFLTEKNYDIYKNQ